MLDSVLIIEKTGNLVWSFVGGKKVQPDIVNECIIHEIIPKNLSAGTCRIKSFTIDFLQDENLLYLSFYPTSLHISYGQELLKTISQIFSQNFYSEFPYSLDGHVNNSKYRDCQSIDSAGDETSIEKRFTPTFKQILASFQSKHILHTSNKLDSTLSQNSLSSKSNSSLSQEKSSKTKKKLSTKEKRVWDNSKISKEELASLDFSQKEQSDSLDGEVDQTSGTQTSSRVNLKDTSHLIDKSSFGDRTNSGLYEPKAITTPSTSNKKTESSISRLFGSLSLERAIDESMLTPVVAKMKEHLIQKNVAADIANNLCDSVSKSLVGTKMNSFQSLSSHLKQHIEQQLKRILTPKTSTDLLREIMRAKERGQPYSMVFVGVNGVGKSTNLSKVCFWLLQNKFKILIAACDTFRSGAVEQLSVHARNLKSLIEHDVTIDLFEKGYGKDSAGIAKDAIQHAKSNNYDVVLIDTAGRMQNNEPLMRALAKLVTINNPDKIIFVGEALVGNEAVDQLTKFNLALKDYSGVTRPRQIDGMILTKFDTIDDKVGAALTMTFITGQPILFVGTGQTYTDLRKLDIQTIVNTLLS